jgi:cytochrome oxidase Cu insertion factor (SCO1/SenC/PrrC family)
MSKAWGKMAKFLMALTCAGIFWLPGAEFSWIQNASGQVTFQAYPKPQVAPDFSLENLQGKRVDTRDHRGQVLLLNFWATW